MAVRAKFKVISRDGGNIRLNPVINGSAENEQFFRYTPGGSIDIQTLHDAAAEQFVEGKEYYVDFTPAE
ncbi:hypothetical protein SH661x_000396 [Planctomicrobium sp. SH661]|uniref:hypothetical protein n=1 Tax=Planctomicrobium sp. SH661 TaxID=3448124 RepID=UPI003F5C7F11